jgi:hypothetical protein
MLATLDVSNVGKTGGGGGGCDPTEMGGSGSSHSMTCDRLQQQLRRCGLEFTASPSDPVFYIYIVFMHV